jgi:hypothetical protein
MSNHTDDQRTAESPEQVRSTERPLSSKRRAFLKVAASAAPVIATLPSGEALALTSTLQCAINEQDGSSARPAGAVADTDPPQDAYARIQGELQTWTIPNPDGNNPANVSIQVFHIPTLDVYVYGDNPSYPSLTPGNWFDRNDPNVSGPSRTAAREFLYLYQADTAPLANIGDLHVNPSGLEPSSCEIQSTITPWPNDGGPAGPNSPQHCFYPIAVQANQDQPGNIPLTGSCLASFQGA